MPILSSEQGVATLHPAFVSALASLPEGQRVPAILDELSALLAEAAEAMPGHEAALVSHLGFLLNSLDTDGLRRWILTGLRLYPNHVARRRAPARRSSARGRRCSSIRPVSDSASLCWQHAGSAN